MAKTYVVKEWSSNLGEWYTVSDPYPTMAAARAAAERRQEQDSWLLPAPRYEAFAATHDWDPWEVLSDAVVRWEATADTAADRKLLTTLWTPDQLYERGEADRGFWAGELLDAIRYKYDPGGRATAEDRARAASVDAALEHALDVMATPMSRRNPSEATATTPTPFEGPSPYRVIVLTMHRKSGPKQLVVTCDHREQAIEAAEVERGKQTNRRDNAIVRIDALREDAYAPIVQWTFRGDWKREMQ